MSDMHESINEEIAESRGYDRGFTAGTLHAHELLNSYIDNLKYKRSVWEEEGFPRMDALHAIQTSIQCLEQAKLYIRQGHIDE